MIDFDLDHRGTTGSPSSSRTTEQLDLLEGVARELMPAVWAMGVTCSTLRLSGEPTRRERELLEAFDRGLGRIVRILSAVEDLVLLEREGELALDPGPSRMESICQEAVAQAREAGVAERVSCSHEGEGDGTWDAERLVQVVSYLVERAALAAPLDRPEVRLRWKGRAAEVLLVVERAAARQGDEQEGLDLAWGSARAGDPEVGPRAAVARAIVLGHGGSLARFASRSSVGFVVSLPRHVLEELN